jgi:hypothetical protein
VAPTFGSERASLLLALGGGRPDPAGYAATVSLEHKRTGSANHKMWSNPTRALVGLNSGDRAATDSVLDWCRWYVEQALHENECLTPNPSYRGAITFGTWALAGCALERGSEVLLERLLARGRADIAWILLGAGVGPARRVRNHHLDKIGQSVLLVGDGEKGGGVEGLPYFAQAGKRSRVREGGSGAHTGPFQDTENLGLGVLVAQALGVGTYPRSFRDLFDAARRRWPALPPFGFSAADRRVAMDWLRNPADPKIARKLLEWVNQAPRPDHPVTIVRYVDSSVAFFLREVSDSSTGGDVVDVLFVSGLHYLGSVDSGSRDSGKPGDVQDVDPQTVTETADSLVCRWKSGARPAIVVPKPAGAEAFRVTSEGPHAPALLSGSAGPVVDPNDDTQELPLPDRPEVRLTWLPAERAWLIESVEAAVELREIRPDPAYAERRWLLARKAG